jgi:membrane-bound lytic murein transglycosylase A
MRRVAWALIAVTVVGVLAVFDILEPERGLRQAGFDQVLTTPSGLAVRRIPFAELPGWDADNPAEAFGALSRSCARRGTGATSWQGLVLDLRPICGAVAEVDGIPEAAPARLFLQTHFDVVEIVVPDPARLPGRVTGYFEPLYPARRSPAGPFTAPALTLPSDLITADLSAFDPELGDRQLVGRLDESARRFMPYPDHRSLIETPPPGSEVLGYMNPNDLLFLQIQGSGRLRFADGEEMRIGYAGKNGRPYVAVGRTLVENGQMPLQQVSMQSIRSWLDSASPEAAADVRYSNPSYVFFRELKDLPDPELGPLGAEGTQLTPGRSVAIDPAYYPYGLPIHVEAGGSGGVRRLFIAQDTGGAIRGPHRADIYFGTGEAAGRVAGQMNVPGRLRLLIPKATFHQLRDEAA